MKYRKLRIAWSAVWGIAAVLLVAFWVRSYWFFDFCEMSVAHAKILHIEAVDGRLEIFALPLNLGSKAGAFSVGTAPVSPLYEQTFIGGGGVPYDVVTTPSATKIPIWILVLLASALAPLPWLPYIRWRFSLRTLLIATTLIAVVLGALCLEALMGSGQFDKSPLRN